MGDGSGWSELWSKSEAVSTLVIFNTCNCDLQSV